MTALHLFWGDEFLVRKEADACVERLVPPGMASLNSVVLDGASPREVAQELATLPLLPGRKVVLMRDPEFLAPKKGRSDGLRRAKEAWTAGRRKEGAQRTLALAAGAGWGVDQLDPTASGGASPEEWKTELSVELADADVAFLRDVAAFAREEHLTAPEGDVGPLLAQLKRTRPEDAALVIAVSELDAKNPLVALAKEMGGLVERKVAGRQKDLDLSDLAAEFLEPLGKRLGGGAEQALRERIGGNVRRLHSELQKLAAYVDGQVISSADVAALVERNRDEEYLELSDAIAKRDLAKANQYVEDALSQGAHPLQLLGAVASIVRNLLEAGERLRSFGAGQLPRSFDEFKSRLFPKIQAEAESRGARAPHPYAAFLSLQAATRIGRQTLCAALMACADADLELKSGGGRLVLERLLWRMMDAANVAR
ncbi:MAG: DNA polymerase III subunit delta [Myxococcaceae bacterium]